MINRELFVVVGGVEERWAGVMTWDWEWGGEGSGIGRLVVLR